MSTSATGSSDSHLSISTFPVHAANSQSYSRRWRCCSKTAQTAVLAALWIVIGVAVTVALYRFVHLRAAIIGASSWVGTTALGLMRCYWYRKHRSSSNGIDRTDQFATQTLPLSRVSTTLVPLKAPSIKVTIEQSKQSVSNKLTEVGPALLVEGRKKIELTWDVAYMIWDFLTQFEAVPMQAVHRTWQAVDRAYLASDPNLQIIRSMQPRIDIPARIEDGSPYVTLNLKRNFFLYNIREDQFVRQDLRDVSHSVNISLAMEKSTPYDVYQFSADQLYLKSDSGVKVFTPSCLKKTHGTKEESEEKESDSFSFIKKGFAFGAMDGIVWPTYLDESTKTFVEILPRSEGNFWRIRVCKPGQEDVHIPIELDPSGLDLPNLEEVPNILRIERWEKILIKDQEVILLFRCTVPSNDPNIANTDYTVVQKYCLTKQKRVAHFAAKIVLSQILMQLSDTRVLLNVNSFSPEKSWWALLDLNSLDLIKKEPLPSTRKMELYKLTNERLLIIAESSIKFYEASTGNYLGLRQHRGSFTWHGVSADGDILALACSNSIDFWLISKMKYLTKKTFRHFISNIAMKCSKENPILVVRTTDREVTERTKADYRSYKKYGNSFTETPRAIDTHIFVCGPQPRTPALAAV